MSFIVLFYKRLYMICIERGFQGMVITDYDGSYGYMITDHSIRNGNDLMLGFNSTESNVLSDRSATAILAMRQASKNIMYTIVNSGYYADGDPTGKLTNMDKIFIGVDVAAGTLILAVEAILVIRLLRKKNKAEIKVD